MTSFDQPRQADGKFGPTTTSESDVDLSDLHGQELADQAVANIGAGEAEYRAQYVAQRTAAGDTDDQAQVAWQQAVRRALPKPRVTTGARFEQAKGFDQRQANEAIQSDLDAADLGLPDGATVRVVGAGAVEIGHVSTEWAHDPDGSLSPRALAACDAVERHGSAYCRVVRSNDGSVAQVDGYAPFPQVVTDDEQAARERHQADIARFHVTER